MLRMGHLPSSIRRVLIAETVPMAIDYSVEFVGSVNGEGVAAGSVAAPPKVDGDPRARVGHRIAL